MVCAGCRLVWFSFQLGRDKLVVTGPLNDNTKHVFWRKRKTFQKNPASFGRFSGSWNEVLEAFVIYGQGGGAQFLVGANNAIFW